MKILVLNCGSSSVKYQLIEMSDEQVICKGVVERIGGDDAILRYRPTGRPEKREVRPVPNHAEAIDSFLTGRGLAEVYGTVAPSLSAFDHDAPAHVRYFQCRILRDDYLIHRRAILDPMRP